MPNITRRTLAGAAALPLLPATALAVPAERDPAVEAYRGAWRAANAAYERSFDRPHVPDDDPIMNAAGDAALAANLALCDAIATTPEGLAGQVHLALHTFGTVELGEDPLHRCELNGAGPTNHRYEAAVSASFIFG